VAVFGVVLVVCGLVVTGIGFSVASLTPLVGWARTARIPLDQYAIALSLVLATWIAGRLVHGERHEVWERVGLGKGAWKPLPLVLAALAGVLVIAVPSLLMVASGAMRFEPFTATDSAAATAWAALALMLPAAFSEELMVRGYVFAACRDGAGTVATVVVTSIGFGLAHLANPDPTAVALIAVMCAGVFLALVRLVTGSLVAAILAHLAFNLTQAVALHAPVSGLALQTPGYRMVPTGPDWLTGGAWGPEGGLAVMAALTLATFLLIKTGVKNDRRPVAATEPSLS
jgi:membrane protease YdiL (CAAX protease family)